ncbi:MAG: SGNH/GDSL hydrolase family protein [Planctomycetota bacterium JB042]
MSALPLRRKVAYAAAATALALGLVGAAAEVGLRVVYEDVSRITGVAEWSAGEWEGLTYHWDAYHPRLGWTNRPGYESDARVPFRVTINAQGLRGPRDHPAEPPPNRVRVALFGDSCAFGEEVHDAQTVAAYLERRLRGAEVLNFGVHGYGLGQMVLRLEEEGFSFSPDHVVVLLLVPGDLDRDVRAEYVHPKPVFGVDADGRLEISNVPVPEASRQPWIVRRSFVAAWLFGRPRTVREVERLGEVLRVTHALFDRLERACDERDVSLTVVPIVTAGPLDRMKADDGEETRELLSVIRSSLGSRDGLDVLDLVPSLERWYAEHGSTLVAPHRHWTGPGNCLIADAIGAHLAALRPEGLSVRTGARPCVGD